ncbi:Conserved_hypothetical protein [Hexamita inflata]|uniref:Uncharacterized protein n=1 Tax=Hexamita inflata TaxID=28002 RepID=A0AA86R6W5_9EUKA|nr:Conserved hypothetical protein [Hexamita inflata]
MPLTITIIHSATQDPEDLIGLLINKNFTQSPEFPDSVIFKTHKLGTPQPDQPFESSYVLFEVSKRQDFAKIIQELATQERRDKLFKYTILVGLAVNETDNRVSSAEIIKISQKFNLKYVEVSTDFEVLRKLTQISLQFAVKQQRADSGGRSLVSTQKSQLSKKIANSGNVSNNVSNISPIDSDPENISDRLNMEPPRNDVFEELNQLPSVTWTNKTPEMMTKEVINPNRSNDQLLLKFSPRDIQQQVPDDVSQKFEPATSVQPSPSQQATQQLKLERQTPIRESITEPKAIPVFQNDHAFSLPLTSFVRDSDKNVIKQKYHNNTPLLIKLNFAQNGIRKTGFVKCRIHDDPEHLSKQFCSAFQYQNTLKVQKIIEEKMKQFGYLNDQIEIDFPNTLQKNFKRAKAVVKFQFGLRAAVYDVIEGEEKETGMKVCQEFGLNPDLYLAFVISKINVCKQIQSK